MQERLTTLGKALFALFAAVLIVAVASAAIAGTGPGPYTDWTWKHPLPQGNSLKAIASNGGGLFVAVGGYGSVVTSSDNGATWTIRDSGVTENLVDVAYGSDGGTGNVFVAVGDMGAVLTSSDGATWTKQTGIANVNQLYAVAAGGNLFVVTGYDIVNTTNKIFYSSNGGATWTATQDTGYQLNAIAYCNSTFYFGGFSGGYGEVISTTDLTSTDFTNVWKFTYLSASPSISGIACSGTSVVAVNYTISSTLDSGATWTTDLTPRHVARVRAAGGQFIAVGRDDSVSPWVGTILTSSNGAAWTSEASGSSERITDVAWGGSGYIAIGELGAILKSSTGSTWTPVSAGGSVTSLPKVVYGKGAFLTGDFLMSTDRGETWSAVATIPTGTFYGLSYANDLFFTVGYNGAIYSSPDGATWTERLNNTGETMYDVAYGNCTYVAVGGANDPIIYTSHTGSTWTKTILPDSILGLYSSEALNTVAYGKGKFVAGGVGSTYQWENLIMYSSDGITWNEATLAPDIQAALGNGVSNIVFSKLHDKFFALATSQLALTTFVITSLDGVTWSKASDQGGLHGIAVGGAYLVGTATGGELYISTDGITWTKQTKASGANATGTDYILHGAAYGEGTFVLAGQNKAVIKSNRAACGALSSPSATVPGVSGGYFVGMSADPACHWTAFSNEPWITVTDPAPAGVDGSGLAQYTVTGSTCAQPRTGMIDIGGNLFTVTQGSYIAGEGTVLINFDAAYTKTAAVTLSLICQDPVGCSQVCVSNTPTCSTWTAFTVTKAWTLTAGNGLKTVYVKFKNKNNAVSSSPFTDTIILDAVKPVDAAAALLASAGAQDNTIDLFWSAATDTSGSGVKEYRIAWSTAAMPLNCLVSNATTTVLTYTHTGLSAAKTYYYRVCAVDNAGNISAGKTASAKPHDATKPINPSIMINNGAEYTKSTAVTLALSVDDAGGATQMCVSNATPTCSAWIAKAAAKTWTLPAGDGIKTVYAKFKDGVGNVSDSASTSIKLDTLRPFDNPAALSADAGGADNTIALSWGAAADGGVLPSGVAGYRIAWSTAAIPLNCLVSNATTTVLTYTHTGLSAAKTYYYRVCAVDNAGNISGGKTASAKPHDATRPATPSITINSGAPYAKTAAVALSLGASDAGGIATMCVSNNTPTCTAWTVYAPTKAWTLPAGDGTKTVYAKFRDAVGNASDQVSASIILDTKKPTNGTFKVRAGGTSVYMAMGSSSDLNGVAALKLAWSTAAIPVSCSTGSIITLDAAATDYAHDGLTRGKTCYYRLCALDNAGNLSAGVTATAKVPLFTGADLAGTWYYHGVITKSGQNAWLHGKGIYSATTATTGKFTWSSAILATAGSSTSITLGRATVSVGSDGTITTTSGDATLLGSMTQDKGIMAVTGTTTIGGDASMMGVFVKLGAAYTAADLAGSWTYHGVIVSDSIPVWVKGEGLYTAGSFSWSSLETTVGTVDPLPGAVTLRISAAGLVTALNDATLHGALSKDKKTLVMVKSELPNGTGYQMGVFQKQEDVSAGTYDGLSVRGPWSFHGVRVGDASLWLQNTGVTDAFGVFTWTGDVMHTATNDVSMPPLTLTVATDGTVTAAGTDLDGSLNKNQLIIPLTLTDGTGSIMGIQVRQ